MQESSSDPLFIDNQYKLAVKILHTLQHQLNLLETGLDTSVILQGRISTNINALGRCLQTLNSLKTQHPSTSNIWAIKIKKLNDEQQAVRSSMEQFLSNTRSRQLEEEKAAIRRQVSIDDPSSKADGNYSSSFSSALLKLQREERIRQNLSSDISTVDRTHRTAYEIKDMAISTLEALRQQNWILKRTRRRILDLANTIGLSQALLLVISRRQTVDQVIVYSGMLFTLALFVILVYYFRL